MKECAFFPTHDVVVSQCRYDELLHKEALLDAIERLHDRMTDYAFRDALGHLLKTEMGKNDEES